jgi:hypothetical protein
MLHVQTLLVPDTSMPSMLAHREFKHNAALSSRKFLV